MTTGDGARATVGEGELAALVVQSMTEAVYSRTGRKPFRDELAADVGIAIKPLIAALKEARADNEALRVAVNRDFGEPLDEVYKVDGITIVMDTIHQLRAELAAVTADRDRYAAVIARVEGLHKTPTVIINSSDAYMAYDNTRVALTTPSEGDDRG